MLNAIIRVSKNAAIYRGFTITKSPRTAHRPLNLYGVSRGDAYFGCEFAEAEAVRFIDRLHAERKEATHG
jgi:hypothetical protein